MSSNAELEETITRQEKMLGAYINAINEIDKHLTYNNSQDAMRDAIDDTISDLMRIINKI